MTLEEAQLLLGKRVAVNGNGGSLFTGKLISICESPSITLEVPELDRHVHLALPAIDGWVAEGTPERHGGGPVSG